MKRYFRLLSVTFAIAMLFNSCLKGDDSSSMVYNDTAITSFRLGTLKMQMHTKSSTGADSVFIGEMDCSEYRFHIDQIQRRIFNTDSLPKGVDLTRTVCFLSTYNNGTVWLEDETGDVLTAFSSKDSIDFSRPVKMCVYGYNSADYTTYTVTVNEHKEDGNEFKWEEMPAMTETAREAYELAQVGQPTSNGGLLIGRSTTECYSLTKDDGLAVSKDNGETWEDEYLADDEKWLPTEDFAYVCYPYSTYLDIDYVLIGGSVNTTTSPQSEYMHFWYKIVDFSDTGDVSGWSYIEVASNNFLYLPRLMGLSLVRYDDKILAIGVKDLAVMIYESKDGGITWKESPDLFVPEELAFSGSVVTCFADDEDYIWLLQRGTGKLWRGRYNRMGWNHKSD